MKTGVVKLYNDISTWSEASARNILYLLDRCREDNPDRIAMHVHCYGGSVTEGNLIYNGIQNSDVPVDIIVDGIAASMAAFLLPAASKTYMCENAFLMLHAPAAAYTSGRGTADEHKRIANALDAQQDFFIKALMGKTGKTRKEVEKWLIGDNWFSAQQALDAGLIDGIVEPVTKNIEALSVEQVSERDIKSVYDYFMADLEASAPAPAPVAAPAPKPAAGTPQASQHNDNNNQNSDQMNVSEQLVAALKMEGKPTEEQIIARITQLQGDAAEVAGLRTRIEAYEQAEKDAAEAALVAKVDQAITKDRKVTEKDRAELLALGRSNPAALDTLLAKLPAATDISGSANGGEGEKPDPWQSRLKEIDDNKNKR